MKEITIAGEFLTMLIEGADRQQLDSDSILFAHQVHPSTLRRHEHANSIRIPLDRFANIAVDIMRALNDEYCGLGDRPQPLGSFNMMCRACISTNTVMRSLKRCANYWNLFNNTFEHQIIRKSDRVIYRLVPRNSNSQLNPYLIDAALSSVHRFHSWLAGQFIPLIKVSKTLKEPSYSKEYNGLFYGSPMLFDADYDQLEISSANARLDVVQTVNTLDQYLLGANLSLLYQAKTYRVISEQVRQWLERSIRQGEQKNDLADAANHFQMSQQVLHRKLQNENTSYKEIKQQTRRDIAINLLFSDKYKIEQIATMVGYSEPSAFIRAFKNWTGLTPFNYRQNEDI